MKIDSGQRVFEQIGEQVMLLANKKDMKITEEEYEQWKEKYVWESLQYGTRYGQSFCNYFNITDNKLYYTTGNPGWCDRYIRETYIRPL